MISITLKNKIITFNNFNNEIFEILIFGSFVRKENDNFSDLDILVICKNSNNISLKKYLAKILNIDATWISLYSKTQILEMLDKGSLFLWHIKLESIFLYSKNNWLKNKLVKLNKYNSIDQDLKEYLIISTDILNSISNNNCFTYDYELSLIATLLRNVAILHCYKNKLYIFGRKSAFLTSQSLLKNKLLTLNEYNEIYKYRLKLSRNNINKTTKIDIKKYVLTTIKYIQEVINCE